LALRWKSQWTALTDHAPNATTASAPTDTHAGTGATGSIAGQHGAGMGLLLLLLLLLLLVRLLLLGLLLLLL